MATGYLVSEDFVRQSRWMYRQLHGAPQNAPGKRAKYPVFAPKSPVRMYRLTEDSYIHRGSHPDGAAAEEVRLKEIDQFGRAVWQVVREDVTLYCGSNGVYVQRDTGRIGNDPGDPDNGGDPETPPPCPPYCVFTGNGPQVVGAPAWWYTGAAAAAQASTAATVGNDVPTVYAVTGMRQNGYDFTIGTWETVWVGVLQEDMTAGAVDVTIDGIGQVSAAPLCSDPLSEGTTVHIIWRELGGFGGFAILGAVCCPGYDN